MGKHAQLVIGPAGVGKSTYCNAMKMHCEERGRTVHVVNLDPAAETFAYTPTVDVRELVHAREVGSELKLGPNGALLYCVEFLVNNLEWLEEKLGDYSDDYLIFDCPGQVELYTHVPLMARLGEALQRWDYAVCAVYLLDSHFVLEPAKFVSGSLSCLSAMLRLGLPHVSLLSKVDLLLRQPGAKKLLKRYLYQEPDLEYMLATLDQRTDRRFGRLNSAVCGLLLDYRMVSYLPLDLSSPDSLSIALSHIDNAVQYGDDVEVSDSLLGGDDDQDNLGALLGGPPIAAAAVSASHS